jgi:AraC-like DNA-binding protein
VLEGQCWLLADGASPVRLTAGELVILPRGEQHTVCDDLRSAILGLDAIIADHPLDDQARLSYGGSGPQTRLLCGGFALGASPMPLAEMLPAILRLNAVDTGVIDWLAPVLGLVRQEAKQTNPGAPAMFAKLADIFLAQALRTYLIETERAGLLPQDPLADPQMGALVTLIRNQSARPWTVQALAREVGMSRTLFTTRFRAAIGESPMRHVARVRLGQAAEYLTTTRLSVDAIARRTGYGNSAALSKAFKREYETTPGQYRENQRTADIVQVR